MLGSPPPNYFGVSIDRLRNYIPPSCYNYSLQSPKILPPPLSSARPAVLLPPPVSPRASASSSSSSSTRHTTNPSSTGSDAMTHRRRRSVDLSSSSSSCSNSRPFSSKRNSVDSSSWPPLTMTSLKATSGTSPSSSTLPSSSSLSTITKQSPSSSSPSPLSVSPFPSPFPSGPVFPGLGLNLNPMTSALALRMGMLAQPHHTLLSNNHNNNNDNNNNNSNNNHNNNNNNTSKLRSEDLIIKHPSKMMTNFPKPHPYMIPFGPRLPPQPTPISSFPTASPPLLISPPPPPPPSSTTTSKGSSPSISSSPTSTSSQSASLPPSLKKPQSSMLPSQTLDISPPALFPYPKLFTPFITPEQQHQQQQQYITMLALQQEASSSLASASPNSKEPPSSSTPSSSLSPPSSHSMKNAQSSSAAFATRNYLELAMLVCNTFRGKLFPCPHCRYVTDRRNNLKRHVATMHQACDKQLECCGVTFATKASLREHIAIFHHNGYSCTFCGRRFCRKALLKRHLSVHNGQKDYTCPSCDYATSHKSNLERHKRIHARLPENGESPILFQDMTLSDEITTNDVGLNYKNRNLNLMEMPSSSTSDYPPSNLALPYYYNRFYKQSFPRPQEATSPFSSPNSKENDDTSSVSMPNALLHPYFFKERARSSNFSNFKSDLMVTSTCDDVGDGDDEGEGDDDVDDENDIDEGDRVHDDSNSDSDIDIDSLDDNDNIILEKSSTEVDVEEIEIEDDDAVMAKSVASKMDKIHAGTVNSSDVFEDNTDDDIDNDDNDDDDSNIPLNLVKVRQENE